MNREYMNIGEEYTDDNGKIWLKMSDKVYVENTPITLEEALGDPRSMESLMAVIEILRDSK